MNPGSRSAVISRTPTTGGVQIVVVSRIRPLSLYFVPISTFLTIVPLDDAYVYLVQFQGYLPRKIVPQWLLLTVPYAGSRICCIFLTQYIYDDDDDDDHHHNYCYDDVGDTVLLVSTFTSNTVAMCSFVQSVDASATCFLY